MATYYVRSGAAGAGTGADWANAYTTLATALSGKAAGDTFYVSEDHSESGATVTLTSPGTASNPCRIICVDHAGSVPPVSADLRKTAAISTTSGNLSFAGTGFCYGVIFTSGNAAANNQIVVGAASTGWRFSGCSLRIGGTGTGGLIQLASSNGAGGTQTILDDTTVSFANASQSITVKGDVVWQNTSSALLGTVPTTLVTWTSAVGGKLTCRGVDLSAAGSGKTLISNTGTGVANSVDLVDCKIDNAVTIVGSPTTLGGLAVDCVRVSGSGVNYTHARYRYAGTLTEETTIVRTGGASDGTTTLSWKIVTTANSTQFFPFESLPIAIWNDTIGSSVTATVECRGAAVPNDDEVWLDVEYLGSSSSPLASFVSDYKADILASGSAQASSSESWGGSTASFKLNVTFTPQQKGWIFARVKVAKASSTFYIDPKVTLT